MKLGDVITYSWKKYKIANNLNMLRTEKCRSCAPTFFIFSKTNILLKHSLKRLFNYCKIDIEAIGNDIYAFVSRFVNKDMKKIA